MIDFIIRNEGTIVMFEPVSADAQDWVVENVRLDDWQWLGPAFGVDHRYAAALIEAIQAADFDMVLS